MKVFVLPTGYLETDAAGIVAGESGPIRLPVLCFLLQTPEHNLLFDTGCHPDPFTHGGYCKADLDLAQNDYTLLDADTELFPGVEVVQLPGHTPGLMGLVAHLAGGVMLLPQDCVYTAANYGPPVRRTGSAANWEDYHASIDKLRALQARYNAKIIFAHDWAQAQTLQCAPDFYA